jgi:hypothetical protein
MSELKVTLAMAVPKSEKHAGSITVRDWIIHIGEMVSLLIIVSAVVVQPSWER